MKTQINEIKRMQQLAGVINESQLNENESIKTLSEAKEILNEVVQDYISDSGDTAGEDLDWGKGVTGYDSKKQLIQDFIDYLTHGEYIN
jgi:hypothetical protein